MNLEKLVNSKVNVVADWIIRLIVLNVLMIFSSLLIITIYPAISAGFNMFNDYVNQKDTKLFKGYFGYLKENIVRKMILSLIIGFLFVLSYSNIRFYSSSITSEASVISTLGYYVMLSLAAILYAVSLFSFVVNRVNSKLKFISLFKLSFYMAGKYYLVTIGLVVVNTLPVILLFFPQTVIFFILMGISLPVMVDAFLTRNAVNYLEDLGEQDV